MLPGALQKLPPEHIFSSSNVLTSRLNNFPPHFISNNTRQESLSKIKSIHPETARLIRLSNSLSWQSYVQQLVKAAKSHPLRHAAVRALAGLLTALPHFNLRESLLQALVPRMDAADDVISGQCCGAIRELFGGRGTAHQEAALEAVQLIADFVSRLTRAFFSKSLTSVRPMADRRLARFDQ